MSTLSYHFPEFAIGAVIVPSARDGRTIGIMISVVKNADKGAGNTERYALSSSAWRFATRILVQT